MRLLPTTLRISLCAFLLVIAALGQQQGTSQGPAAPKPAPLVDVRLRDWKPATLPADAVAYGAALESAAPPKIKDWCDSFARKEMPKRKIDPRETMAVVDKQFPKNSDAARDAAIYLVNYLAYREEDRAQEQLAAMIRRMDEEAHDIKWRMQLTAENEMNRLSSTRQTVSQTQMIRNDQEARAADQKLAEMSNTRKQRMKELEDLRRRVEGYLRVMAVTHPRMNGIEPAVLREFQ